MLFELEPHIGAGKLKLGMRLEEIKTILGEPGYHTQKHIFKSGDIELPQPTEVGYFDNELQITFDENEESNYFEFSGRSAEHLTVKVFGRDVFKCAAPELLQLIQSASNTGFDKEDNEIPYSYVFPAIDLSLWRDCLPELDENENEIPESDDGKYFWTIGIGIKGYYASE